MPLETYRSKRDFARTPEPAGDAQVETSGRFVVQRHRATRLHYDLRLEMNGVMASWAVPRGPTLDPDERRLAMKTEDHPIEYLEFEAVIPSGQYGAGDMIVWDWGTYEPEETDDPTAAVAAGELKFRLHGERLRGRFTLVKTRGRTDEQGRAESGDPWLLIHKRDEHAEDGFDAETQTRSVKTGRTNDELAAGREPRFEAPPPAPEPTLDLSAATEAALPEFIPPMLATAGERPYEDANWLHEVKWDGYRVQAVVRDGKVKLWTRNRADGKTYFPELTGPPTWIDADEAVVDGEVVAFNEDGLPSFSALQERTGLMGLESRTGRRRPRAERDPGKPPEPKSAAPIIYQAFDLLYLDGRSLLDVPLESRKRLLHRILRPHPLVQYATHVVGEGPAFLDAALAGGLEGVVAKKRTSRYRPGERSADWVKIKVWAEQEVAVIGWLPRQGSTRRPRFAHRRRPGSGGAGPCRPGGQRPGWADPARAAGGVREDRPSRRAGAGRAIPAGRPLGGAPDRGPGGVLGVDAGRPASAAHVHRCPRRPRRVLHRSRGPAAPRAPRPGGGDTERTAGYGGGRDRGRAGRPGRHGQGGSVGDRWPGREDDEPGQGALPWHRQPIPRR